MSTIVSSLGRRVRYLRTQAGMTQERLAERAEISVSFLSMIERGERSPHLETLERLAHGLEVSVQTLFDPAVAPLPADGEQTMEGSRPPGSEKRRRRPQGED